MSVELLKPLLKPLLSSKNQNSVVCNLYNWWNSYSLALSALGIEKTPPASSIRGEERESQVQSTGIELVSMSYKIYDPLLSETNVV